MAEVIAYFKSVDLTTLLIACGVVVLIFIVKRPLVLAIFRVVFTGLKKKSPAKYEQLQHKLARLFGYILFFSILLIALPYLKLPDAAAKMIDRILTTVLMLLSFLMLYRALMIAVEWYFNAKTKHKRDHLNLTARNFLVSGIRVGVIIIAAVSILTPWVGSLSGLIAGLGISSLAVALAAQDSLSHFFGSISIMLDKPFDVGDFIVVSGDLQGTIEHVGLRSTRIRQLTGSQLTVPNATLASAVIYNETKREHRRVRMTIGLEYRTPDEKLTEFVKAVEAFLLKDPDIDNDSIMVWFDEFAESSLNIGIVYTAPQNVYYEMLSVKDRINHGILQAAKAVGVSMAFPSVSIYNADTNS